MSDDIKELVERLRASAELQARGGGWADPCKVTDTLNWNAADALEALAEKVDSLNYALHGWVQENAPGGWIDELRKKAQERDSLREVIDHMSFNWIDCSDCDRNREVMKNLFEKEKKEI
jgi:hypothetical protein